MKTEAPPSFKVRDSAISTLLCATIGVLLLETWVFTLRTTVTSRLFGVVVGTALIALLIRRVLRLLSRSENLEQHPLKPDRSDGFDATMAGKCLVAAALGYAAMAVLLNGWLTTIAFVAAILVFAPWGRIVRHRLECVACWAVFSGTSAIAISLSGIWTNPVVFLFVTYALWTVTLASWMRLLNHMRHAKVPQRSAGIV